MSDYQLLRSPNTLQLEKRLIQDRINQLEQKQFSLTGEDYRRCKISIAYNKRLLTNPKTTVNFSESR